MSAIRCKIPSNSVEWSDPNGKSGRKDFEMDNYIMLNGRKFEINEKNSLLLRAIVGEEIKEKEPLFAQMYDKEYYFIRSDGRVEVETESNSFCDDERHKVANYCSDRELMCQRALHETLNRLLWRFSEMHGGDVPWDGDNDHAYIIYDKTNNEYSFSYCARIKTQGTIYFPSAKCAQAAIETVIKPFVAEHPDFVW